MRTWIMLMAAAAFAAAFAATATGADGFYGTPGRTLNGGIYVGGCVVEFWGQPGASCPGTD